MRICIICSVRSGTPKEVSDYVAEMEFKGHQVYFPTRDTPQDDPTGLNICLRMAKQIQIADEIHIFYYPQSQGIHFDLGVAFALGKKWKLINNPEDNAGKSYIKVIREIQLQTQVNGQLNPEWVTWLMGFPPGWLNPMESQESPQESKQE